MQRRDLWGECNIQGAPVDVFTAECCLACVNPECTRSNFGHSKFEIRVANWYDHFFAKVPRMSPDDPRYNGIAFQKFIALTQPIAVNSWVDPRDITEQPVISSEPLLTPPKPLEPPVEAPKIEAPEKALQGQPQALLNTSVQQGQMIGNKPAKTDSWDAPAPTSETENVRVVKSGEKIRLS